MSAPAFIRSWIIWSIRAVASPWRAGRPLPHGGLEAPPLPGRAGSPLPHGGLEAPPTTWAGWKAPPSRGSPWDTLDTGAPLQHSGGRVGDRDRRVRGAGCADGSGPKATRSCSVRHFRMATGEHHTQDRSLQGSVLLRTQLCRPDIGPWAFHFCVSSERKRRSETVPGPGRFSFAFRRRGNADLKPFRALGVSLLRFVGEETQI